MIENGVAFIIFRLWPSIRIIRQQSLPKTYLYPSVYRSPPDWLIAQLDDHNPTKLDFLSIPFKVGMYSGLTSE